MIGRIALAACFVLPVLAAGGAGANEDQQAALCRGDVMRLCLSAVPDRDAIVSCMKVNRTSLSAGCRSVFDGGTRGRAAARSANLR
ncbi:hypothetical protein [Methylobacterium sp. J-068]|uniref:hypothetical protein n=1 Tax=Methylobacterium sp. J-068 TaxID=2836649 RepID=UPI001FBAAEA2|nr:hypothetical protein [Methylobacterium sp. J-068]MCJ2036953.1 hypothetical protein [Methylobacterium sp. J-068]